MKCPYCQTENRDDQENCYHCNRDLSMLRLIVNKAKHHFNQGLELAERGREEEAIGEMKNALDLDASLINARVVLGTLYAKQEQFEEARRCWQQAMEQDHRLQKAHEYLARADVVESALPAIKKLQKLSMALGAFVVALVVLAVALAASIRLEPPVAPLTPGATKNLVIPPTTDTASRPQTGRPQNDEAAQRLQAELETARAGALEAQRRADALEGQQLDLAVSALSTGANELALDIVAAVRKSRADGATLARADQVAEQALSRLLTGLRAAGAAYFAGSADFSAVRSHGERLIERAQGTPTADAARDVIKKVEQAEGERLLAIANAAIAGGSLADAVRAAGEFKSLQPDRADAVNMTLDLRLDAEATRAADAVRELVGKGSYAEARKRIDDLELAFRTVDRPVDGEQLRDLRRSIDESEASGRLANLQTVFSDKLWEPFLEQAGSVDRAALDDATRARLDGMIVQARAALARENWEWFQQLDPKFSDGRIGADDAARAAAIYRATIDNLPDSMRWATAPILFYAATSHMKLDRPAEAARLLKEIDAMEKVPGYIKPTIEQFKQKHADALGG
jgi:tetratricopeptide (TPR) repeat protein